MTKRATILLSAAVAACGLAQGQIVFEYADLPMPGETILRYVDTLPAFGPGGAGPAQDWDMSMAMPDESVTTTVSTVAATPYASSFNAGSNLAMTNDGVNFLYFNSSAGTLVSTGAAGDFLNDGQQLVVPFSPTLTLHQLPRQYGDQFSDTYAFQVIANGAAFNVNSIRLRHKGSVRDTTDAYGTLTTPVGTYDVLRVKTTDHTNDSIWIRLFAFAPWTFAQATVDTSVSYTWLAKETRLAVAEMTFDSLGAPARFTYSSIPPAITTRVAEAGVAAPSLYPVPSDGRLTVRNAAPERYRSWEVVGVDGRVVLPMRAVNGPVMEVSTVGWAPGIYIVQLWSAEGQRPLRMRAVVE